MREQPKYSLDEFKKLLRYQPDTGEFLRLLTTSPRAKAGNAAGRKSSSSGRYTVCVFGTEFLQSRLAWFFTHGSWPTHEVEHINGDPSDDRACNLRLAFKRSDVELTQNRLKEVLSYSPNDGVFTWKKNIRFQGQTAGYVSDQGYVMINVDGRTYRAHRLAWFYSYGAFPSCELDHINVIRHDNRIENLREATRADNNANTRAPKTNKSGYKGVSYSAAMKRWQAHIRDKGKSYYLGCFDDPYHAHLAYADAARRLKGEFARTS